jgi:hypothetical protein
MKPLEITIDSKLKHFVFFVKNIPKNGICTTGTRGGMVKKRYKSLKKLLKKGDKLGCLSFQI